jgi:hypothetical protein
MPFPTATPSMGASSNLRIWRVGCISFRVVLAPAAMPLRLKKGKEERKRKGERGVPELEGGRGLWPTNIAICIKRSPYFSCCLVRWTASFPL